MFTEKNQLKTFSIVYKKTKPLLSHKLNYLFINNINKHVYRKEPTKNVFNRLQKKQNRC